MNAKEIFENLVERAMSLIWTSSSLRRKPGKPGEMIERLPQEERNELQNLTSKDAEEAPRNHLSYMLGAYPESTVTVHKLFPNKKDDNES